MSAPARALLPAGHIHLPSVHVRDEGGNGFDYEEDIYTKGRGRLREVVRAILLAIIKAGEAISVRETRHHLSVEEQADLVESLPFLLGDDGFSPLYEPSLEAQEEMEKRGRWEYARQLRIAAGQEHACAVCGCSESRACSVGCIWVTATLCWCV